MLSMSPKSPKSPKAMKLHEKNIHARDALLKFDETRHRYTVGDRAFTSVTQIVSKQFPKFDGSAVVDRMMSSPSWKSSKYFGMTKRDILDQWSRKGKVAREQGTALHKIIEDFFNDDEIEVEDSPELQQFLTWHDDNPLTPVRTEWKIFDDDAMIAGTIDAVFVDDNQEFVMLDWKRCQEIKMENAFQSSTTFEHLPDCNFAKYSMQLNGYREILERKYDMTGKTLAIVNFHPSQEKAMYVPAMDLRAEVREIFKRRLAI